MDKPSASNPTIESAYLTYSDMLYRVAVAELRNEAEAQDAVQDVFIKYMSTTPVFSNEEHTKAWFLRVTVNTCHDYLRKRKVRNLYVENTSVTEDSVDSEGRQELFETLASIPEKYKSTVILHCLEGLSLQETAKVLGISLSAAKMRLSRAREALRKEE